MIYNFELIIDELTANGIEVAEHNASLKYQWGYHRYEKRLFGHIRVKPEYRVIKFFNLPVWISRESSLERAEKILSSKIGLPHAKKNGMLFYWIPFTFNKNKAGVEIITIRE